MTEQSASGTMANAAGDTGAHGLDALTGESYGHEEFHGRPVSWVAAIIIIVGFIIGGIALVPHPHWWLFWTAAGIVVIGTLYAASIHIFDDWY